MFNENLMISKWIADMYDQTVTEKDDVDFLLSVIGQAPKQVLEVCCGSGRILVPLAKAGHVVTGFDADEFMLAKLPAKAAGLDNITWRKADAIHGDWDMDFDVVVLAGNILYNIVSDMEYKKAQAMLIQKAAHALATGGHVYIDYQYFLHPEKVFDGSGESVIWDGTDREGNHGKMILIGQGYDAATQINKFTRRFELRLQNGEIIRQDIPNIKHFATLGQIYSWLDAAGLRVQEEYGDYNRNPINETTRRAILYARKG